MMMANLRPRTKSISLLGTVLLWLLTARFSLVDGSESLSSASLNELQAKSARTSSRTRTLDQVEDATDDAGGDDDGNQDFQYDLTQFSLRYEKCQYVKMYDEDLASQQGIDSPLALKHFVVYKLCPTDACGEQSCGDDSDSSSISSSSSSSSSEVVYGKYTVPVDDYLKYVVENRKQAIENSCKPCENDACTDDASYEACNAEGDEEGGGDCGLSCSACEELGCDMYNNLEANGLVDASNYIECQALQVQGDGDDDQQQLYYIGPRCNQYGRIVIGVFADEECWEPVYEDVETLLGAQLSYHLLNESYSENHGCLSCAESDNGNNNNERDGEDADAVNEMCEKIYNAAAKCESETGLSVGFVQTNRDEGNYENQVENEYLACTFINSLIWNSYTETGEINFKAPREEISRVVTKKQTIALSLISCWIAATVALIFFLDRKTRHLGLTHPLVSKGGGTLV